MEVASNRHCRTCNNLDPTSPIAQDDKIRIGMVSADFLSLKCTIDDIRTSSNTGCRLCSVLSQILNHFSDCLILPESFMLRLSLKRNTELGIRISPKDSTQLDIIGSPHIEIYAPEG